MEYNARLMISYMVPRVHHTPQLPEGALGYDWKATLEEKRLFFRIWGRSKASITALWEEGRYSEFCAQDDGTPVTALDVLQVVDYVVPRLGKFENYVLQHEPKLCVFNSDGLSELKVRLYWIDANLLSPYMLRVPDSDGKEPNGLPIHGKTPVIEQLYALDRWASIDEELVVKPRVPVKDPKSGRYVMHECLTKDTILFRVKATRVR